MRRYQKSSWRRQRGVVIVWIAFLLFALVLLMGMALDAARMYMDAHQLQNAADAAALAAAQYVKMGYLDAKDPDPSNQFIYPEVVYRTGQEFARAHAALRQGVELYVDEAKMSDYDATADVVIGHYRLQSHTFTPYDPEDPNSRTPNAAKVVARQVTDWDGAGQNRAMPLIFGRIAGVDHANVVRVAIAMSKGTTGAGLIALSEDPNIDPSSRPIGLRLGGGSIITVNDGDVQVNSWATGNPRQSFRAQGNFAMECEELKVVGDTYPPLEDESWDAMTYNVHPNTEDPLPDPLGHAPALWSSTLPTPEPAPDPGYMPLPDFGQAFVVDGGGNYIPAINNDPCSPAFGQVFDATVTRPIDGEVIEDYGQDIGGTMAITLSPGYFPAGIQLTTGNKITLLPGVYAFGGGNGDGGASGLLVHGGVFHADGVMLYVTASTALDGKGDPYWGVVDLNGGSVLIHESYDPDDPQAEPYPAYVDSDYKYIAIFQDRDNPQVAEINGNTELDIAGTIYLPTAHLELAGTGIEGGTQLIAGSISTAGNTEMTINYDGRFWTPAFESLLVE